MLLGGLLQLLLLQQQRGESSYVIVYWAKRLQLLVSSVAVIFDFVILGYSIADNDGRALTHSIILLISAIIPLVHFLVKYRSEQSQNQRKKQELRKQILLARKLQPNSFNRQIYAQKEQEAKQVLLKKQDEEQGAKEIEEKKDINEERDKEQD
ncbi:hypothetical protein FGO68_gene3851 [Halteria grandinella]|uniref:Uncharacterized protein n=1 Tax=Halteria grandinella TaxID=5974 RepID=A0A8J8NP97_HALGN|nr:hypothetical protein FGO68_gene3851 [Halteria grandinella]